MTSIKSAGTRHDASRIEPPLPIPALVEVRDVLDERAVHVASWPSFTLYRGTAYALGHEVNLAASQIYALEGGCFVLHASAITGQDMFDTLCDTPEKAQLLNADGGRPGGGYSMIFGPRPRQVSSPGCLWARLTNNCGLFACHYWIA